MILTRLLKKYEITVAVCMPADCRLILEDRRLPLILCVVQIITFFKRPKPKAPSFKNQDLRYIPSLNFEFGT